MIIINHPNVKIKDFTKEKYETKMLFRCTTQLYAEKFLETGNIRFSYPEEWIADYKINGDGRGDLLEGCYGCMPEFNLSVAKFYSSLRPNSQTFHDDRNNYLYFRSNDVLQMPTFCLFGLDKKDFKLTSTEDNKEHYLFKLSQKFFTAFYDISKEIYDNLPPNKKPVLLMIHNPHEFNKRLRAFMIDFGIRDDEWIVHPVGYSEKNTHFLIGDDMPAELFSKDISFEYQKEIRTVIYTKRQSILKKLNACNRIVDLGCMKDIASIQEYYFDDMLMELKGKNRLIFTLPKPIVTPLEELPPEKLIGPILQAYENSIPGENLDTELKRTQYITPLLDLLERIHNIEFNCENITFKNKDSNIWIKYELEKDD